MGFRPADLKSRSEDLVEPIRFYVDENDPIQSIRTTQQIVNAVEKCALPTIVSAKYSREIVNGKVPRFNGPRTGTGDEPGASVERDADDLHALKSRKKDLLRLHCEPQKPSHLL